MREPGRNDMFAVFGLLLCIDRESSGTARVRRGRGDSGPEQLAQVRSSSSRCRACELDGINPGLTIAVGCSGRPSHFGFGALWTAARRTLNVGAAGPLESDDTFPIDLLAQIHLVPRLSPWPRKHSQTGSRSCGSCSARPANTALRQGMRLHHTRRSSEGVANAIAHYGVTGDEQKLTSRCRSFLTRSYPAMKKANPSIPIMIREASGTEPTVYARFGV